MHVPDWLKTVKMCERAIQTDPWQLHYTPNPFETQKIIDDVMQRDLYSLLSVPD